MSYLDQAHADLAFRVRLYGCVRDRAHRLRIAHEQNRDSTFFRGAARRDRTPDPQLVLFASRSRSSEATVPSTGEDRSSIPSSPVAAA